MGYIRGCPAIGEGGLITRADSEGVLAIGKGGLITWVIVSCILQ